MAKLFKVFVELYELLLTARKDDRSGRVVSTGLLKIDDLIAIAVTRRSDINAATMKASYEILKEVAMEELCNAKQVEFGLTYNGLGVDGVFVGDHPSWDSTHHLLLRSSATAEVRNALKNISVEVLGMASSGLYISNQRHGIQHSRHRYGYQRTVENHLCRPAGNIRRRLSSEHHHAVLFKQCFPEGTAHIRL
jgi:uncharacterized protein YciU (UPF0263 family)